MARQSKGWLETQRERFRASKAGQYLIDVAEGTEKGDPKRLRAAEFICNKVMPNPPVETIEHQAKEPPAFYVDHPPEDD